MKLKILTPLIILLIVLVPTRAFAVAPPDNASIGTILEAYKISDVLVPGDVLYFTDYDIQYNTLPTDNNGDIIPASEVFSGSLYRVIGGLKIPLSGGTAEIYGKVNPEYGYGEGMWAVYFEEAPTILSGTVNVCNLPNPTAYGGPAGTIECSSSISTLTTKESLESKLVTRSAQLQIAWSIVGGSEIDLINTHADSSRRFTALGEEYITNTIPNIREILPGSFESGTTNISYVEETYNVDTSSMTNYFSGSDLDQDPASGSALTVLATWAGIPVIIVSTMIIVGVCAAVAFAAIAATGRSEIGMLSAIVVLGVGTYTGMVSFGLTAILALTGALALGYIFFYKGSTS